MQRLTTKQRLSLVFSLYVFLLLSLVSVIFIIIFRFSLSSSLSNSLEENSFAVINQHLAVLDQKVVFTSDPQGTALVEKLTLNHISALFLDNNLDLIEGFGIYRFNLSSDGSLLDQIVYTSSEVLKSSIPVVINLLWHGQPQVALVTPMVYKGSTLGVAIFSRSSETITTYTQLVTTIFSILVIVTLGLSFLLGHYLVSQALKPVDQLAKVVEKIDLEKKQRRIKVMGHPQDELVILSNKFNLMLTRLRSASKQQMEFISNASHELRSPLTRAITAIDLSLFKPKLDKNRLTSVKSDLFEINNMLEKLLYLSRLKKDTVYYTKPYELKILVDSLLSKYAPELKRKQIKVSKAVKSGTSLDLPEEYASALLSNLITNAIKYSHSKTVITIKGETLAGDTYIQIIDQGIGIKQKDMNKIFNRFYRAKSALIAPGHGIGLSLVKRICDLYHISLAFDSSPGKGTTVSLRLKASHQ